MENDFLNQPSPVDLTKITLPKKEDQGNMLDALGAPEGGALLDELPAATNQEPLSDSAIKRRSFLYTVADLTTLSDQYKSMGADTSLLDAAIQRRQQLEETIRLYGDTDIREKNTNELLKSQLNTLSLTASDMKMWDPARSAAQQSMALKFMEIQRDEDQAAAEQKFVQTVQGLLETGNVAEAQMVSTLYRNPTAWRWAVERQEDYLYMQKVLEETVPEEKDRNVLFGLIDVAFMFLPFISSTANTGNYSGSLVKTNWYDDILSGERLNNEIWAIRSIQDPVERRAAYKELGANIAKSTTDFGWVNKSQQGMLKNYFLNGPPSVVETNVGDAIDAVLAPTLVFDALSAVKGAKAISTSAIKTLKRAGLRNDAAGLARDVMERIKTQGPAEALKATGETIDDVTREALPTGLNPEASVGDVPLAGALTPEESLEEMQRRLFGDLAPTERLTPEEQASIEAKFKAQVKKDFGRHVHSVDFDIIELANKSRVLSPVVILGTTDKSLFITISKAEEAMASLGLDSAVVKPIASDNGILYGIEARLPISESQYYTKLDKPPAGNFLTRWLAGARQTSSPELYGLSEVAVAKHQKVINNLQREVGIPLRALNNDEKNILYSILVKSEKDQKWFSDKELDLLWARQTGYGDPVREITDTEIRLGNIVSPGGDPEFLSQKAFLDLKDRSNELGKQIDEIVKNSGAKDEATFWENASEADKALMDELTAVNAEIAKGPQKVELDAFLEPHTYKAQRAASATPAPAQGKTRVYHGGEQVNPNNPTWVTTNLEDAKGWAGRSPTMKVFYTDIDADDVRIFTPGEGAAEGFAPRTRFELTPEESNLLKPLKEGEILFPSEHEDLWQALDIAADRALAKQAKAGDQAIRSMRRTAALQKAQEARKATWELDEFLAPFKGGALTTDTSAIDDLPSVPLYSFTRKQDLLAIAEQAINALELPGGRFVAWPERFASHDQMLNMLNDMLAERKMTQLKMEETSDIFIEISQKQDGSVEFGKAEVVRSSEDGVLNDSVTMTYGDISRLFDTYSASGAAFTKRIKDAERRANKAIEESMTGGSATEGFRKDVDEALTLLDTKVLVNAQGQRLHTNRNKLMTRELQWSPEISGFVPDKVKRAYHKWRDVYKVEKILRSDGIYLDKATRGFQTIAIPGFGDVDGIVYRGGSLPPVPSSRVYDISAKVHHTIDAGEDLRPGYAHRLTASDIKQKLTKDGYVMIRLETPIPVGNNVHVQWVLARNGDINIKPLKFEQIGEVEGGHRGYLDKHFAKQARLGTQGDTGEQFLMSPSTFIVGTEAEVKAWATTMETARGIWNNADDADKMRLLSNVLDGKPGFPSAEEFADMIKTNKFNPDYPVEALFDREMPSDYAKLRTKGWEDMSDEEQSGIHTYMQTHGKMYNSPKGDKLTDWRGQEATLIDPFEMMNKALNNVASMSSLTDYKMRSIEKWVKTFGPYLDLSGLPKDASPVRIFQESVFLRDMPEAQRIRNAAEAQRDVIKRNLGWRSELDREFEYMGRKLVSFVAGDKPGKWNKAMARGIEYATEKDPLTKARKMAFHMKLGLGNVAQFPMQISTMLAVMSLDVRKGLDSFANLFPMRGMILHNSGPEWIDMAIERGFHKLAGFGNDPVAYQQMMMDVKKSGFFDLGGSHQLSNYYGIDAAMSGTTRYKPGVVGDMKDLANKALTEVGEKGTFFFTEAELWNRIMAYQLAWKELHASGKFVKGTPAWYEALLQKSADYTFNMSRAGSAAWQKGWASIPTQFLSYQARVLEAIFGKQLTLQQKIRLGLGQFIFYGTAGIPFMAFASEMMRGQAGEAPKIGTWDGLVDRGVIDTLIYATTGADVQYGERAATGAFVTDTFRELLGMSKYGEVSFVDVMAGPVGAMVGDTAKTFLDVLRFVSAGSGGETGLPLSGTSIVNFARNVTSFDNAFKAYMVWNYGEYITKSGKVVLDDLPSTDAFAVFLGLTPGEYRDYVAKQEWRRNRQDTVKKVADKIVELRERLWREPDKSEEIAGQLELLYNLTPSDVYIDANALADKNPANESIYEGLAQRYEIEKQQQQLGKTK